MARESHEAKRVRVRKIIALLKRAHPDAKLALDFSDPLELLVALILAAQARDDLVNLVTPELFRKYRTAAAYADEKEAVLQKQVSRINFFRQKTRSIQGACAMLVKDFGGRVPENIDDLLKLPGVGLEEEQQRSYLPGIGTGSTLALPRPGISIPSTIGVLFSTIFPPVTIAAPASIGLQIYPTLMMPSLTNFYLGSENRLPPA